MARPEIVNARREGLDEGEGHTLWYAVCRAHGTLVGARTREEARTTRTTLDFCDDCRAGLPAHDGAAVAP